MLKVDNIDVDHGAITRYQGRSVSRYRKVRS